MVYFLNFVFYIKMFVKKLKINNLYMCNYFLLYTIFFFFTLFKFQNYIKHYTLFCVWWKLLCYLWYCYVKLLFLISLHLCQVLILFALKITCFDKRSMLYMQMSKQSIFTRLSLHFILNFNFKSTAQEFRKSRVTGLHAICIFRLLLQCTTVSSGYTSNFKSSPYVSYFTLY